MLFLLHLAFLENARVPYKAHFLTSLPQADFTGFRLAAPAECDFSATPTADGAALLLCVKAQVEAECARCLEPLQRNYDFQREYLVRPQDVEDPDFELPCSKKGCLDLEEL